MTKHFHARLKRWNKMFFGEVFGSTIKAAEKEERNGMTDSLPTTRDDWAEAFPDRQTRFLAWCNATRRHPLELDAMDAIDFMGWISERSAAFRRIHGIRGDSIPPSEAEEFTDFLWSPQ